MAYIGNTPAENYASFLTETFTVSATTNYTLSHAVANENDIRLVINGVVQQPGSGKAYTASGTTLTLSSATASGDSMYAVYLGRALQTVNPPNASVGASQIVDGSITEAKFASGVSTITEADQWRLTTNTGDSSGQDITATWERNDSTAYAKIGTGMSESSGIFTFASTGIYLVTVQAVTQARNGNMNQGEVYLKATTNNSSYSIVSQAENQCLQNNTASVSFSSLIDVTDTSNVKVKIATLVSGGTDMRLLGTSTQNRTAITFVRLGDT